VDPTDFEANATNVWLEAKGLPQLPPIDSVSQWTAMLNQSGPARSEIQLSSLAIVVARGAALYKLVLGAQPYSRWTGDLYPNCSRGETPPGVAAPVFIDLKILGQKLNASADEATQAALTWQQDCGATGCLFDVAADPTEHHDLAGERQPLLAELRALLHSRNAHNFDPPRGTYSIDACRAAVRNGGYYGPFVDTDYPPPPPPSPGQAIRNAEYEIEVTALNTPRATRAFQRTYEDFYERTLQSSWKTLDRCI